MWQARSTASSTTAARCRPGFVSVFGLTGGNLANALSQLSGEAATGGQQVAFQMTNQFLGLMLDPFVDGRSGVAGAGGPALGFAPEREDLPDDIALAYSSVLKAPPAKAPSFEQRWSVWGGAYGGSNRTSGDPAVVGSHDLAARAAGFAAGLDYRFTRDTVVGMALAGGGTNWSLANVLGGGKSDAFQAGLYGATRGAPPISPRRSPTPITGCRPTASPLPATILPPASTRRASAAGRERLSLRTIFGGLTPYAAIQAQNFRTPSYSETDLNGGGFGLAFNSRTGTDTRSELGARFDACWRSIPMRCWRCARGSPGRTTGSAIRRCRRVPGASRPELHRQRRDPAAELCAGISGRGASPCKRRHAPRQVRWRVRLALLDLRRHPARMPLPW